MKLIQHGDGRPYAVSFACTTAELDRLRDQLIDREEDADGNIVGTFRLLWDDCRPGTVESSYEAWNVVIIGRECRPEVGAAFSEKGGALVHAGGRNRAFARNFVACIVCVRNGTFDYSTFEPGPHANE